MSTENSNLEIRDVLQSSYPNVYTPDVLIALAFLTLFNTESQPKVYEIPRGPQICFPFQMWLSERIASVHFFMSRCLPMEANGTHNENESLKPVPGSLMDSKTNYEATLSRIEKFRWVLEKDPNLLFSEVCYCEKVLNAILALTKKDCVFEEIHSQWATNGLRGPLSGYEFHDTLRSARRG